MCRIEHVTFREGLTKCLKVNEVAYPLYFSTSFYTYPLYYRRPLHNWPDLVYVARRVDVPRNQTLEKHVSKLSIIAFTRRSIVIRIPVQVRCSGSRELFRIGLWENRSARNVGRRRWRSWSNVGNDPTDIFVGYAFARVDKIIDNKKSPPLTRRRRLVLYYVWLRQVGATRRNSKSVAKLKIALAFTSIRET